MTRRRKLPYLPLFTGDFAGATRGWTCCARLVYLELLAASWDLDGLPTDEDELRRIVNVDEACWARGWPKVALKFEQQADGKLRNARLEEHRKHAQDVSDKRSAAGRAGADKRWQEPE